MTTNIIFLKFWKLYFKIRSKLKYSTLSNNKIKTKLDIYRIHNIKKTIYNTPYFLKIYNTPFSSKTKKLQSNIRVQ